MQIKTFPLKFIDIELDKIGEAAESINETKEEFIKKAIKQRVESLNKKEEE